VISVDISAWAAPSSRTGKRARDCESADEVLDEVWHQLATGLGSAAPDRADVRTATDLASMEGANEAARRAVRGILRRHGRRLDTCPIWPLSEGRALELAQRADRLLFPVARTCYRAASRWPSKPRPLRAST
jgi:hypothetical protein